MNMIACVKEILDPEIPAKSFKIDPEANIFGIAHYGVVAEYEKALPAFMEKCKEPLSKR